jgi:hypothetical protein
MKMNDTNNLHKINGLGVFEHNFAIDAPFLMNPISLKAIDYLKLPIQIVNFKSLDILSNSKKQFIYEQVSRLFMLSMESYVEYQEQYVYPVILDKDNSSNPILHGQYGLFAKNPIEEYQVIGFYSGIYASSHTELGYMLTQYDFLTLGRYGNACHIDGIPVICGHYNGNYMSLINDWRPFKWYEYDENILETIKDQKYNCNTIIASSGDYFFVINVANKKIDMNTEIITDYGKGYWQREQELFLNAV